MIETKSLGSNEISESLVSVSRSFDPDKRIDVNQRQDVKHSAEYDPDKRITVNNDIVKNCPIENGIWNGERGNSKWYPDGDYIPQKKNPDNQAWKEILNIFNIDGINFKDGEPNFSEISSGNVKIEGFSDNRDDNFDKADIELSKQKGCSPEDVDQWRKENGYTWHECRDMKTMQKVPSIVHNNVSHRGGISEMKNGV